MIRVALHVNAGPRGGPRTYGVALARALAATGDIDLVVLTEDPEPFGDIPTVRLRGPRPFADHVTVPRLLRRLSADVYHNTKNSLPRVALPCPAVVTLHDLAYHHFPETFGFFSRLYLKVHHEHAAHRADRIICVSNHAKRDVIETLRVPESRIDVVHHGVADAFFAKPGPRPAGFDDPYILSVGTIQARKNLDVLVRAVARVRERREKPFTLAIAGRRGWKTAAFDRACDATPVRLLGLVPDESLPALYSHAAAFVQPSSYEGFGLTAAEAMACGTPVIAADAGSLPEVVGSAALMVPARDEEALARCIDQVLDHLGLVGELAAAGEKRARQFTWERSALAHLETYLATHEGGKVAV
ncbi:MAG: glycosyltransferase family 4 protein [Planctomycetota bacterium]